MSNLYLEDIADLISEKCKKYGLPAPDIGELWESALLKVLVLIEYLESKANTELETEV